MCVYHSGVISWAFLKVKGRAENERENFQGGGWICVFVRVSVCLCVLLLLLCRKRVRGMDIGERRNARNDWIKKGEGAEGKGGEATIVTRQKGSDNINQTRKRKKKGGNPEKQTYMCLLPDGWMDGDEGG